MAVLLLRLNLPPSPIWIAYSSLGFDIRANHLTYNLMDLTQINFFRKYKLENFEVFISESVCSKANTETLKSGGWRDYKLLGLKFYYEKHIFPTNSFFWSSAAPPGLELYIEIKSGFSKLDYRPNRPKSARQDFFSRLLLGIYSTKIFGLVIWFHV